MRETLARADYVSALFYSISETGLGRRCHHKAAWRIGLKQAMHVTETVPSIILCLRL
jgi:hypothetical protein